MSKRVAKASKPTGKPSKPTLAESQENQGKPGFSQYRGMIQSNERSGDLQGVAKYKKFSDLAVNVIIVATGIRAHLNLASSAGWNYQAANDTTEAQEYADLLKSIMEDMETPWRTVVRRLAFYRWIGAALEEKRAKLREDGVIGIRSIQRRPMSTIERWEFDAENGDEMIGAWQRSPQDFNEYLIDRWKLIYVVDDTISDSPEGLGMLRHLVEAARLLGVLEKLEGFGFQNCVAGMPIIRAPIGLLQQQKDPANPAKPITAAQVTAMLQPYLDFLDNHALSPQRGLLLDSATYRANDPAQSISGTYQYQLDIATFGGEQQPALAAAIERKTREMARLMGIEHLLLGTDGTGSLALGKDKSNSFAVVVNGTLDDIGDAGNRDVVDWIWEMNNFPQDLKPKMVPEAIAHRDVAQVTSSLAQLASAGLDPEDPATNEVRDLLGLSPAPEREAMDAVLPRLGDDGEPLDPAVVDPADPNAAPAAPADTNAAPPPGIAEGLNGAQISALLELITSVANGKLPRDSAIELITAGFPTIDRETASRILGTVGAGFVPTPDPSDAPPPTAPAAPPAPAAEGEKGENDTANQKKARSAVKAAIEAGDLKAANDVPCVDCGHEYEKAGDTIHEYDHHLGYAKEHWLDVEAVCADCHHARTEEE